MIFVKVGLTIKEAMQEWVDKEEWADKEEQVDKEEQADKAGDKSDQYLQIIKKSTEQEVVPVLSIFHFIERRKLRIPEYTFSGSSMNPI